MRHYSLVVEERLIKEVDRLIKEFGLYSSRSDFIRDAVRARLIELKRMLSEVSEEDEAEEELSAEAHKAARAHRAHDHEHAFGGVR